MTDVTRLNNTIATLRGSKGSRRPGGKPFVLTLANMSGILQGPRGNIVAEYSGDRAAVVSYAEAHVARIPGATLSIF